jgi:site-specific DNA-cytosine methylase
MEINCPKLPHMYKENKTFVDGWGACVLCQKEHAVDPTPIDIMLGGFCCQPFSKARARTGKSAKQSKCASDHPLFTTIWEVQAYLQKKKPLFFVVEELREFNACDKTKRTSSKSF